MSQFITRCQLDVNGLEITDFKAFEEKTRTLRKPVNLMYKTGSAELTQRFSGSLDYVVPRDKTPFAFDGISGGTLTITFDSGTETRFGGVSVTQVTDTSINGESELERKVEFIAESRNGNYGATI
jgi:hypothetical protein